MYQPPVPQKKPTRSYVWRQWRIDSPDDIALAFSYDIFKNDGSHFIKKNQDEQQKCDNILKEHFDII